MKVLLLAAACNPYCGSEHHFGWAAIKCLAQDNELCVITSQRDRSDLAKAEMEGLVPSNVQFVYVGNPKEWHPNRLLARVQSWNEYAQFAKSLGAVASQLHQEKQFEVAHHVTYSTWRVPSPLWRLGIP